MFSSVSASRLVDSVLETLAVILPVDPSIALIAIILSIAAAIAVKVHVVSKIRRVKGEITFELSAARRSATPAVERRRPVLVATRPKAPIAKPNAPEPSANTYDAAVAAAVLQAGKTVAIDPFIAHVVTPSAPPAEVADVKPPMVVNPVIIAPIVPPPAPVFVATPVRAVVEPVVVAPSAPAESDVVTYTLPNHAMLETMAMIPMLQFWWSQASSAYKISVAELKKLYWAPVDSNEWYGQSYTDFVADKIPNLAALRKFFETVTETFPLRKPDEISRDVMSFENAVRMLERLRKNPKSEAWLNGESSRTSYFYTVPQSVVVNDVINGCVFRLRVMVTYQFACKTHQFERITFQVLDGDMISTGYVNNVTVQFWSAHYRDARTVGHIDRVNSLVARHLDDAAKTRWSSGLQLAAAV